VTISGHSRAIGSISAHLVRGRGRVRVMVRVRARARARVRVMVRVRARARARVRVGVRVRLHLGAQLERATVEDLDGVDARLLAQHGGRVARVADVGEDDEGGRLVPVVGHRLVRDARHEAERTLRADHQPLDDLDRVGGREVGESIDRVARRVLDRVRARVRLRVRLRLRA